MCEFSRHHDFLMIGTNRESSVESSKLGMEFCHSFITVRSG